MSYFSLEATLLWSINLFSPFSLAKLRIFIWNVLFKDCHVAFTCASFTSLFSTPPCCLSFLIIISHNTVNTWPYMVHLFIFNCVYFLWLIRNKLYESGFFIYSKAVCLVLRFPVLSNKIKPSHMWPFNLK